MKRKIRCNTNTDKFTVKARDSRCKDVIIKKAKDHEVSVKIGKRSRSNYRLWFACSKQNWRRFYREIKSLCVIERVVVCMSPQSPQKIMLKNLHAAVRDGKLSPVSAQKASNILAAISAESVAARSQAQVKPSTEKLLRRPKSLLIKGHKPLRQE